MDSSSMGMAKTEAIKRVVRLFSSFIQFPFFFSKLVFSISHSTQPESTASEVSKNDSDPLESHESNELWTGLFIPIFLRKWICYRFFSLYFGRWKNFFLFLNVPFFFFLSLPHPIFLSRILIANKRTSHKCILHFFYTFNQYTYNTFFCILDIWSVSSRLPIHSALSFCSDFQQCFH